MIGEVSIREYRQADRPALEGFMPGFQDFERSFNPRMADGRQIASGYLEQMLRYCETCAGRVFVAEQAGSAVGFVTVLGQVDYDDLDEVPHRYARITELYVDPAHRGRGVGRLLLERAEDHARLSGARLLKIGVLAHNAAARGLYDRCGFRDMEVVMEKSLG